VQDRSTRFQQAVGFEQDGLERGTRNVLQYRIRKMNIKTVRCKRGVRAVAWRAISNSCNRKQIFDGGYLFQGFKPFFKKRWTHRRKNIPNLFRVVENKANRFECKRLNQVAIQIAGDDAPRAAISRDGKYVVFTSNMANPNGCSRNARVPGECTDVYLITLN
jgi:hypothetical protein